VGVVAVPALPAVGMTDCPPVLVVAPVPPEGRAASSPHAMDPTTIGNRNAQVRTGRVSERDGTGFIGRSSVLQVSDDRVAESVRKINVVKIFTRTPGWTPNRA
jgi:hypothetical protein